MSQERQPRRLAAALEMAGQAAFAVMCLAVTAAAISFVLQPSPPERTQPPKPLSVDIGERVSVPASMPVGRRATVVLVLSSTCAYCTASVPYYKTLAADIAATAGELAIVVTSVETEPGIQNYLKVHDLSLPTIAMSDIGIRARGTPVLLVVDPSGVVTGVWPGLLDATGEKAVREALALEPAS